MIMQVFFQLSNGSVIFDMAKSIVILKLNRKSCLKLATLPIKSLLIIFTKSLAK